MHKLMIKGLQLVSWMKDHKKTKEGIGIKDGFTGRNNKAVVTTKGWRIKIKWRDGSYD